MKTKLFAASIVALALIVPFINGSIVEAFGRHTTYRSVDVETGDVYRVHERTSAYCDGTIVTKFRAHRIGTSCDVAACDRADFGGCAGSYGSHGGYGRRPLRGPNRFRGVRVSFGSAGGYGSCDSGDYGSCAN